MFDHYSNEPVFNVKAMAHQTGVAAATLRAWERRYGVPTPPRTDSGYRLYSARDIAIIRWLKTQLENGMSISQAVQLLHSIDSQTQNGHEPGATTKAVESDVPASYRRLHDDIVTAATEFNEARMEYGLSEAFSLFPVDDVCLNLIQPVLVTLGDKWHAGEINVSVEHFATNIVRRKLSALMLASPPTSRDARIISACAPGEYHELGILMISLFLRRRGYNVIYLGQSISALRLQETLTKTQPNMLLLSASGLIAAAHLLDTAETLRTPLSSLGVTLAFGGRIFNQLAQLRAHVPGLYIGDDAQQATLRITELMLGLSAMPSSLDEPQNRATLTLLDAFRRHHSELVAMAMRLIPFESEDVWEHKRIVQANENLLQLIDAALRFGEPSVLSNQSYWLWEALPPDGITTAQLHRCARALSNAAENVLPVSLWMELRPYFQQVEASFADNV